jgi:hypothetical protein
MKKYIQAAKLNIQVAQSHRSFRRFARKLFASLLKRQDEKFQKSVMREFQDIKQTLEMMAREMVRQLKR